MEDSTAKMNRLDLLKTTVPLLYTKSRETMGAYYAKEGAETLLGIYICAHEYQQALEACETPTKTKGSYLLTERFPLDWLRTQPETRPKGARTTQWNDYLHAKASIATVLSDIIARSPLHPCSSKSAHITVVLGEHL
jgi:hypothetical protein